MINVRIIEGTENRDKAYEEMKYCLNNGIIFTNGDISKKYGVGAHTLASLRKELCDELKITFPQNLKSMIGIVVRKRNKEGKL